jgi:uncharacterized membrane protein YeaQ/YmgE (transglycosylase-associated protein family)
MNIIAWVILGLIAGAIAKAIYPGNQGGGILATLILGIIGAFVGGTLYSLSAGLSIGGIFLAVIGAIIAIFIWGLLTRRAA